MSPNQRLTEINQHALDAAFNYKALLLAQPAETLNMLARHIDSAPDVCLGVLRDLGLAFGQKILTSNFQGARRSVDQIAEHCAYGGTDGSDLDALFEAFPALWQIADQHFIFQTLADHINSSHETGARQVQAAERAADRAHAWLGSGLSEPAWLSLASAGGPAWRAFSSAHARYAQKGSGREPTDLAVGQLHWRAAKRLESRLGSTGFGECMHWLHAVSEHATFSDRLEAAAGLSSLIAEARAERAQPGAYPDASRFGSFFAKIITQALFVSKDNALWDGLARTAFAALMEHDPQAAHVLVKVPFGFGLFGLDKLATIKPPHTRAGDMVGSTPIPFADLLLIHPGSFWRARGFELGASEQSAQASFDATSTAQTLTGLKHKTQTEHPTSGSRVDFDFLSSLIEQWSLGLCADANRFKRGNLEPTCSQPNALRL